jgi:hypothetical protein
MFVLLRVAFLARLSVVKVEWTSRCEGSWLFTRRR